MRTPRATTNCKAAAVAAAVLMAVGTWRHSAEMRSWAILVGVFAAGAGITAAITKAADEVKTHVKSWAFEPFERGFSSGRESGIAEGFALTRGTQDSRN